MEPERFDDVELQVLEEPVPRGPRRATRWMLATVAAALSVGALAAGASALTGAKAESRSPTAKQLLEPVGTDVPSSGARPCRQHDLTTSLPATVRD
jgi:hypothetical protein